MLKNRRLLVLLILSAAVSACGGGDPVSAVPALPGPSHDLASLGALPPVRPVVQSIVDTGASGGRVVNGRGEVVVNGRRNVYLWTEEDGLTDLGPGRGFDIAESGDVLILRSGVSVVWSRQSGFRDLDLEPGAVATAMNNVGQFVGSWDGELFFWSPEDGTVPLEGLPEGWSTAKEINDRGTVIGNTELNLKVTPFIWTQDSGARVIDGYPGTFAVAIDLNNNDEVVLDVGAAYTWSPLGGIVKRADMHPLAINDRGEIAGFYRMVDTWDMACIWTPQTGLWRLPFPLPRVFISRAVDFSNSGTVLGSAYALPAGEGGPDEVSTTILWKVSYMPRDQAGGGL